MKRIVSIGYFLICLFDVNSSLMTASDPAVVTNSRCMQTLSKISLELKESRFVASLNREDAFKVALCQQITSGLVKTAEFFRQLSQRKIPQVVVSGDTRSKIQLLDRIIAWITFDDQGLCDILTEYGSVFVASDDCLGIVHEQAAIRKEQLAIDASKMRLERLQHELAEFQKESEIATAKMDHYAHVGMLSRAEDEAKRKAKLAQEEDKTAYELEIAKRRLGVYASELEQRVAIAASRKQLAEHELQAAFIKFTQDEQIAEKLHAIRAKIEGFRTAQRRHCVDRNFAVIDKIGGGIKLAIDTLSDDCLKIGEGIDKAGNGIAKIRGASATVESTQHYSVIQEEIALLKQNRSSVASLIEQSIATLQLMKEDLASKNVGFLQIRLETLESLATAIQSKTTT